MVDMTHDNDNGCTGDEFVLGILVVVDKALLNGDDNFLLDFAAKLHCNERCGIVIDNIGNGGENA